MNGLVLTASTSAVEKSSMMGDMVVALTFFIVMFLFVIIILGIFVALKKRFDLDYSKDEKYALIEIGALKLFAKDKNIDLQKEKVLYDAEGSKSFRRKIEDKVFKDFLDSSNEKPKKEK